MELQNTLYKYVYDKGNRLPELHNKRLRYETSSENVYSIDLSTSGHFQSSTFVPNEIANERTTSSFASIQIRMQRANTDSIHK